MWSKQIRVCSSTDEVQIVTIDLVDQQPVRFDVAVSEVLPLSAERMVLIPMGQRIPLDQKQDHIAQLLHVLAAFLRESHIATELRVTDQAPQGLDCQVFE